MNKETEGCPIALFRQMLLEFQQQGYSNPEKESIFLENLRLNFQLASLPSSETIESYFILSYESRFYRKTYELILFPCVFSKTLRFQNQMDQ